MSKSAIYATMKTSNLFIGGVMGIGVFHIGDRLGTAALILSIPVVILAALGWGCITTWVFKKYEIEDF